MRRKLALSRFGELLKPGEIRSLTDQALESKLQQAAREYNLKVDQLLDEISDPCAVAASVGAALTVRSGAVKSRGYYAAGCVAGCGHSAIRLISRPISSASFASCPSPHTLASIAYQPT